MPETLVHDLVRLQAGTMSKGRLVQHRDVERAVPRVDTDDPGKRGNAVRDLAGQLEHAALPVVSQPEPFVDDRVVQAGDELDAEEVVGMLVVQGPAGQVPGEHGASAGPIRDHLREVTLAAGQLHPDDVALLVEDQAIHGLPEPDAEVSLVPAGFELVPHPRVEGGLRHHVSRGFVAEEPRLLRAGA